jgi:tRNA threonylcarbamoyl adenosine modification protein YeaZ
MKILALETSTKMGSIAITDNTQLLVEFQIAIKDSFSEMLLPSIDYLLKITKTSITDVDAFALSQGPGSFTSLRIGMSVVKGLALKHKVPIIPIPTLDGLAHNLSYSNLLICPLIDARKGEVYTAFYKKQVNHSLAKLTDDKVVTPERLIDQINEEVVFLGDGSILYGDLFRKRFQGKAHFAPLNLLYPRATAISYLALQIIKKDQVPQQSALFKPLYVRPPEAEVNYPPQK